MRSLCARLLARAAVARAESRAKDSLISDIKSRFDKEGSCYIIISRELYNYEGIRKLREKCRRNFQTTVSLLW